MTEETNNVEATEPQYTIEKGANGEKVVVNERQQALFAVNDSFTTEQIDEVYKLCDAFFKQGRALGITHMQNDLKHILGLTAPAEPEEEATE